MGEFAEMALDRELNEMLDGCDFWGGSYTPFQKQKWASCRADDTTWLTAEDEVLFIDTMDINHIGNIIRMLQDQDAVIPTAMQRRWNNRHSDTQDEFEELD